MSAGSSLYLMGWEMAARYIQGYAREGSAAGIALHELARAGIGNELSSVKSDVARPWSDFDRGIIDGRLSAFGFEEKGDGFATGEVLR